MKNLFLNLLSWWQNRKKVKRYSSIIFVQSISDIPSKIGRKIYIVGREGINKWVVFLCPCSKKNRVEVNLMKTRKPFWKLSFHDNKVSLFPSVIVTEKCDCHFWLKNGKAYKC